MLKITAKARQILLEGVPQEARPVTVRFYIETDGG
jgi:hypothetical protein